MNSYRYYNYDLPAHNYNYDYYERSYDECNTNKSAHRSIRTPPLPPDEPISIDNKSKSINDTESALSIPAPPPPPPPQPPSIPYDAYPYNYYSYYNYAHPPLAPIASSSSLSNQQQALAYPPPYPSSSSAQLPAYQANCNSLPNPVDATSPPLNQYQEVTSTNTPSSNVADTFKRYSPSNKISSNETQSVKSSNKNEHDLANEQVKIKPEASSSLDEQASHNEMNKSNDNDDDDLVAFKNKIQIQLKEKLFNDSLGRMKQSSANSSRSVSSSSTNNSLIEEEEGESKEANREKRHHRHHHKHHKRHKHHHHHRHKHHKHKKERHSKTDRKEKTKLDPQNEEENSDEDDLDQERSHKKSLRRSDRIKVIETKKQHHKELVIAEKIKKHHTHNHDSNDGVENGTPRSDSEHCNDISLAANPSEDLDKMQAVKVKDRWRRFSEKELCAENSDQLLNNKNSTELVLTNLNSPCKAESTTFSPNKFDSPRAFKKMLLNKAACESLDSSSSHTNIISSNEFNVDFKELYSLYDHIDENLYLCKKKKTKFNKEAKRMVCDCSTSEQERQMGIVACGDDCLNRLLMIECGVRCPCGEHCTNRNFKTKNNAKIQPFKTEMKGYGLKAANDLKANTFLIEYIGEVIGLREFKKRCEKYSEQNNEHFYFMSLHNDLFIDATKKGNISRFFNHSCDPNCETQKWTVNGELRIGFFTKRPVGVNEELSFDYQFQTVGKKQQKCYCGSEKCRGYLGVSSKDGASNSLSGALNHMWEQESDEEEDEDDEDEEDSNEDEEDNEENGENKESNDENVVEEVKTKNRSSSKRKKAHSTKSHGKHKRKSKDRKKRRSNKDFELNSQIKSIDSLSNKENVLKLCQLMYRTESLESRIDMLNLLLNTKSEISLRLFMDYHGLKLLWSWMVDLDSINDSIAHLECKMKILKVLSMMSIKNRTTLEECKLLAIVKKWSEMDNAAKTIENGLNESESDAELNETLSKKKLNDTEKWVRNEILKIADSVVDKEAKHNHHQSKEISDAYKQLVEQASELVDEWSNLKQEFKIPKKQRDEERKELERELNSTSDANRATSQATNSANANENYSTEKNRDYKYRNRYFNKRNYHENHYNYNQGGGYYNQFDYQNQNLTKEQRRQLFEQHIKEQEAAAAAAQATQEAERVATEATAGLAAQSQPKQELKLVFDNKTQQWIQCYVQQPFDQYYSYYNRDENRMGPPQNSSIQMNANNQADFLQPNNIMNRINITDSHLNDLKQAVQQFMPEVEQVKQTITEKLSAPSPASPILKNTKKTDSSLKSSTSRKSLSMISAKLPPDWKCKEMGKRILYYNTKTKKSQWQYPHAKSSSAKNKSSESQKKAKLDENSSKDKKSNDEAITSTSTTIEPDQANKECDKTTPVQSSVVVSDTASSEAFKICKDQFREKLSKLIVKVLQPFLKEDFKVGHIQNTDDFKHLARKFTHMIMEKEMSRATKIEELDLNKRIKMKAQEFITRYMQRFNGNYSRKTDDQN